MNVIGVSAFQELKTILPDIKLIIAGGMCRDTILGGQFKDIDFYVSSNHNISNIFLTHPKTKLSEEKIFNEITKRYEYHLVSTIGNFSFILHEKQAYQGVPKYQRHIDGRYMGNIPIQIISMNIGEEDFEKKVIGTFNYGIDQCSYGGDEISMSLAAEHDLKNHTATLLHINSTDELPSALRKFERLRAKYPNIAFRTPYKFSLPTIKTVKL